MKARAAEIAHRDGMCDDSRFPIFPACLVKHVREAMPADGIICLDNGVYKIWFARNYAARMPNTVLLDNALARSEEHTSELQSLMRISYAVFCLKKKIKNTIVKQ